MHAFVVVFVLLAQPGEPLKFAWEGMVPTQDRLKEIEKLTSAQKYDIQCKAIIAKSCVNFGTLDRCWILAKIKSQMLCQLS